MSRIQFAADRACNYFSDTTGQSARRIGVAKRTCDHCQSAVVTARVNLRVSFLSRFSKYLIDFIPIDR